MTEYAPTIRGLKLVQPIIVQDHVNGFGDGIRPDNQGIETLSGDTAAAICAAIVTEYAPTIRGLKPSARASASIPAAS